jgi:hypothetical protein
MGWRSRLLGALLVCMSSHAMPAELIILGSQGTTPGVEALAAAFARASGHKSPSCWKPARRWSSGSPAGRRT